MAVPRCAWDICNSDKRYKQKYYIKDGSFYNFQNQISMTVSTADQYHWWIERNDRPLGQLNMKCVP